MPQRGSPGSKFSGTGPRRVAVGRAPGRGGAPALAGWQPAAAGMAAAPAAKPMKARREKLEGEPM